LENIIMTVNEALRLIAGFFVLLSVAFGSPIGHPAVFAAAGASAGVAVARLVVSRFRMPRLVAVLATVVWAVLVVAAAVYTIAAIALSNFE